MPFFLHRSCSKDSKPIPRVPGVYMLYDDRRLYVGEGLSLAKRIPDSRVEKRIFENSISYSIGSTRPTAEIEKLKVKAYLRKLEMEVICMTHTTVYGQRLEERFGLRLLNENHISLLRESFWQGYGLDELESLARLISYRFLIEIGVPECLASLPRFDPAYCR